MEEKSITTSSHRVERMGIAHIRSSLVFVGRKSKADSHFWLWLKLWSWTIIIHWMDLHAFQRWVESIVRARERTTEVRRAISEFDVYNHVIASE